MSQPPRASTHGHDNTSRKNARVASGSTEYRMVWKPVIIGASVRSCETNDRTEIRSSAASLESRGDPPLSGIGTSDGRFSAWRRGAAHPLARLGWK